MLQYNIFIETVQDKEILELNYTDLMISIIKSCLSEVNQDGKINNLPEGINGGTS